MSKALKATSAAVIKVVEVVKAANTAGITVNDIATACGWGVNHTKNVMTSASSLGLVKPLQSSDRTVLWFTPQHAEWFRRMSSEASRLRRANRAREYFRPMRSEEAALELLDPYLLRELSDEPTRRVVLAASAPPVVTTGVRSIFELVPA